MRRAGSARSNDEEFHYPPSADHRKRLRPPDEFWRCSRSTTSHFDAPQGCYQACYVLTKDSPLTILCAPPETVVANTDFSSMEFVARYMVSNWTFCSEERNRVPDKLIAALEKSGWRQGRRYIERPQSVVTLRQGSCSEGCTECHEAARAHGPHGWP